MATYNKFQAFVEHLAEGVHDLGADTLLWGATTNANAPVATNSVLADLTPIVYTNVAAARTIAVSASSQTSGTYKLVCTNHVITASGGTVGPLQWIFIYNDTPASPLDPLICYFDYGSEITLQDGETLTLDFDAANGLLQIV